MTLSRRKTLALIGGGTVLAATAAAGYTVTRPPEAALAPWDTAGRHADPRLKALSYAILAPNPHNRQPWMADLRTPGQVALYVDTDRLLPHTDPFGRQITIGLGCFLELMRIAAAEDGIAVSTTLFPEGSDARALDTRPVAIATFDGTATPDPLFAHVFARRSLKEPFDTARPVPSEVLARVAAAAEGTGWTNDPAEVQALRDLSHRALVIEIETPRTYRESVDLFRIGRREVEANPDGIDFTGPMFETLARTGMMTREAALDTGSTVFRQGLAAVLANTDTAMAHLWQVTATNTRADQIEAGARWLRLNLAATAEGLGLQPLSQALQEYPEMAGLHAQVHERFAPDGGTVQMFARAGYGPEVPPSPRWPVESKIVT